MVQADGKVDKNEILYLYSELKRFGVDEDDIQLLTEKVEVMQTPDMIATVLGMSYEQKKYVAAYLGVILAADGKADEAEIKLWSITSMLCDLPSMSVKEALDYMANL